MKNSELKMSKISEAIDLLQESIDVADKPESEIMQEVINILSKINSKSKTIGTYEKSKRIDRLFEELNSLVSASKLGNGKEPKHVLEEMSIVAYLTG